MTTNPTSKSTQKRIEAQTGEKMVPQSEVDSEEFYNLMQTYRHSSVMDLAGTVKAFEDVKAWIREHDAALLSDLQTANRRWHEALAENGLLKRQLADAKGAEEKTIVLHRKMVEIEKAKLEAENAELRLGLKNALGAIHALTYTEWQSNEAMLRMHDVARDEINALLAKSGAPK